MFSSAWEKFPEFRNLDNPTVQKYVRMTEDFEKSVRVADLTDELREHFVVLVDMFGDEWWGHTDFVAASLELDSHIVKLAAIKWDRETR